MSNTDALLALAKVLQRTVTSRVVERRPVQVTVVDAASAGSGMEPERIEVPGTFTRTRYTGHIDGKELILDVVCEEPDDANAFVGGGETRNERMHRAARESIGRKLALEALK